MIDRGHALPLVAQARQFGISCGGIYYLLRAVFSADLTIMRRIDTLHLLYPFAGSRMLRDLLRQEGVAVGHLHVATLMKRMRIEAIYRRPNTSKPAPGYKVYPYLLRKAGGDPAEPGLGDQYYLHPDGARLRLSCRHRRLVHSARARMAGYASRRWRKC